MPTFRARSSSSGDTYQYGIEFGRYSSPGDIICLYGELGAGKTQFAQGVGAGLGIPREAITSPTYSLIAEHFEGRIPLYHMDAYRLQDSSELGPIGFDDYLSRADGVLMIEWADRISAALPDERIDIQILQPAEPVSDPDQRVLLISPFGSRAFDLTCLALALL